MAAVVGELLIRANWYAVLKLGDEVAKLGTEFDSKEGRMLLFGVESRGDHWIIYGVPKATPGGPPKIVHPVDPLQAAQTLKADEMLLFMKRAKTFADTARPPPTAAAVTDPKAFDNQGLPRTGCYSNCL